MATASCAETARLPTRSCTFAIFVAVTEPPPVVASLAAPTTMPNLLADVESITVTEAPVSNTNGTGGDPFTLVSSRTRLLTIAADEAPVVGLWPHPIIAPPRRTTAHQRRKQDVVIQWRSADRSARDTSERRRASSSRATGLRR